MYLKKNYKISNGESISSCSSSSTSFYSSEYLGENNEDQGFEATSSDEQHTEIGEFTNIESMQHEVITNSEMIDTFVQKPEIPDIPTFSNYLHTRFIPQAPPYNSDDFNSVPYISDDSADTLETQVYPNPLKRKLVDLVDEPHHKRRKITEELYDNVSRNELFEDFYELKSHVKAKTKEIMLLKGNQKALNDLTTDQLYVLLEGNKSSIEVINDIILEKKIEQAKQWDPEEKNNNRCTIM
eukprot:TRINITY_DN2474_c0_g1_i3.p1 TRINITY_DN2474_c0_g1~~TRINITY_DN2474_c0_g1_i3.p1  ORF type:complete len:240 (+),score=56.31 TRINITY_DN2474_c0_g1_i3:592-1311(+)